MGTRVCLFIFLAWLVAYTVAEYDDGNVKSSLTYEQTNCTEGVKEGKAVLTVETAKLPKGTPVVSLTAVIDTSNSMDNSDDLEAGETTTLDYVKLANSYVIDRLAVEKGPHKYGSVTFNTFVKELTPLQGLNKTSVENVKSEIVDLKPAGHTNLLGGILRGIEQQAATSNDDKIRAVMVFTDGKPTKGEIKPERIVKEIDEARKAAGDDIMIHVIAVGDVNAALLRKIAEVGGGDFYHLNKEADIPKAFAAVLGDLLTEVALNLEYTIEPIGDLEVVDVQSSGAEIEWKDRTAICHMRDMAAGEHRAVVVKYSLECPMKPEDGMDIHGKYRDPVDSKDVEMPIGKSYPKHEIEVLPPKPGPSLPAVWDFRQETAKKLEEPQKLLDEGDVEGAISKIEDVATETVASDLYPVPFVKEVVDDLKEVKNELKGDEDDQKTGTGMLEGLIKVVDGGRPASVDNETLKTVSDEHTPVQDRLMKETDDYADGKEPKATFDMPYKIDVGSDEDKEVPEYKVKVSVGSPPIKEKPPMSVTVVVDKDGTADHTNATFGEMKDVLEKVVKDLTSDPEKDVKLGVVLSSGTPTTVLNLTNATDVDVDKVIADIEAFEPTGNSSLAAGMKTAIEQQADSDDHKGSHSVFVITDGHPEGGDEIVEEVKTDLDAAPHPVDVHTFGVKGSDGPLLKKISDAGGGEYHDVVDDDDLGATVADAVYKLDVKASDVEVIIKPTVPGAVLKDSLPEMKEEDGVYKAVLPDMHDGETHSVIATFTAPEKPEKELVGVTLGYTDVNSTATKSDVVTVDAEPKGSTADRELDLEIVKKLEPLKENITKPHLPEVVDALYDAIPIVKDSDVDEDYKEALVDDLETVAKKMEIAEEGTDDDLEDAKYTMDALVDTIKDEGAKGPGHGGLHVQDKFEPPALKEKIKEYAPETPKEEPKEETEPVTMGYKDVPKEISTDEQELTVKMELKAAKIPAEDHVAPSIICTVDTSTGTTPEDVTAVKDKVLSLWKSYNDTPSDDSSMAIISHDASVHTLLPKTPIANITEDVITDAFKAAVPGGAGSFKDGYTAAIDMAKEFKDSSPEPDVKVVAFVGDSVVKADNTTDADDFVTKTDSLGFPLDFTPVCMQDAKPSHFDAYPPWVKHAVVPSVAEFDSDKPHEPTVGRRVTLKPHPGKDVEVVDVTDGIKTDKGYSLPPLKDDETRIVDVKVKLPEGEGDQILHMPHISLLDARTEKEHTVHGEPLSIPRKSTEEAEKLKNIEKTIGDAAVKIDKAVEGDNWPVALELSSKTIGSIDEADVEDDGVDLTKTRLTALAEDIYKIVGEGADPKPAKLLSSSVLKSVHEPETTEPPVDKDDIWPGEKEGPGYAKEEPAPPEVVVDETVHMKSTDETKAIPMKVRAPEHKGDIVDAQVMIIMDNSADVDWKHEHEMAETLLESLAKRQGKRAVRIWTSNDKSREIYFNKDFNIDDLDEAMSAVNAVAFGGLPDPEKVLKVIESFDPVQRAKSQVYWLATTQPPEIDDVIVKAAIDSLKKPTAPTVTAFKPDVPGKDFELLDKITEATGGDSYPSFPAKPEEAKPDVMRKIKEDGWKAVDRIEKAHSKNAKVKIQGQDGAKVVNISVDGVPVKDVEAEIEIPVMDYGDEKKIDVVIDTTNMTKPETGIQDVVTMDGDFTDVLAHKPVKMPTQKLPVEILKPKDTVKVDTLHQVMDSAGWDLFYDLGRNRLKKALVTAKEMQMQPKMAGLDDRPDMKKLIDAYSAIEGSIQDFIDNRTDYKAIQNVSHIASAEKTELPHYSDKGGFLEHKTYPAALGSESGVYHPKLTIKTPSWEKPLPFKLDDHSKKIVTIAAVFDTAEHDFLIDREIGSLTVQKITVAQIVKKLAELDYTIDLQAIIKTDNETSSLKIERMNAKNMKEKLKAYLTQIELEGHPADLVSCLEAGLPFVQDAVDSERLVLLFKNVGFEGTIDKDDVQEMLNPYITYPINPVKVLTYIIGTEEDNGPDPISEITGGQRMCINHADDILDAVQQSIDNFDLHAARGIRVDVKPIVAHGSAIKGPQTFIIGDMKHGSEHSIDLEVELDESSGDEDIFEYTVQYYRPKFMRWFITPVEKFHARRATKEVIEQQQRLGKGITPLLDTALSQLKANKVHEAAVTVHKASEIAHATGYQDDSLIRALFDYLAKAYEDIMELSKNPAADTRPVVQFLESGGCEVGLNVGGACGEHVEPVEIPKPKPIVKPIAKPMAKPTPPPIANSMAEPTLPPIVKPTAPPIYVY